jgi:hypothetical protein
MRPSVTLTWSMTPPVVGAGADDYGDMGGDIVGGADVGEEGTDYLTDDYAEPYSQFIVEGQGTDLPEDQAAPAGSGGDGEGMTTTIYVTLGATGGFLACAALLGTLYALRNHGLRSPSNSQATVWGGGHAGTSASGAHRGKSGTPNVTPCFTPGGLDLGAALSTPVSTMPIAHGNPLHGRASAGTHAAGTYFGSPSSGSEAGEASPIRGGR